MSLSATVCYFDVNVVTNDYNINDGSTAFNSRFNSSSTNLCRQTLSILSHHNVIVDLKRQNRLKVGTVKPISYIYIKVKMHWQSVSNDNVRKSS